MTWIEMCKQVATEFGYDIDDKLADFLLWERTAFGFAGPEYIRAQLREHFTARLDRGRP